MNQGGRSARNVWLIRLAFFGVFAAGCLGATAFTGLLAKGGKSDRTWLDFLLLGSRARLVSGNAEGKSSVVLVKMDQAALEIFSEIPPGPMDWAALLEKISSQNPAVLVVDTPLNWKNAEPVAVRAVSERLTRIPSVVLAVARAGDQPGIAAEAASRHLAPIREFAEPPPGLTGRESLDGVLPLEPLVGAAGAKAPKEILPPDGAGYPLFFVKDRAIYPSVMLETLMRYLRRSSKEVEFRTGGTFPGVFFGTDRYLPTSADGRVPLNPALRATLPRVSAGAFFSGNSPDLLLGPGDTPGFRKEEIKGKIVVIGEDTEALRKILLPDGQLISPAERLALSLETALAGPALKPLGLTGSYIFGGILAAVTLAVGGRLWKSTFWRSVLVLLVFAVLAWLIFQISLFWFPVIPVVILWACAVAACLVVPRGVGQDLTIVPADL